MKKATNKILSLTLVVMMLFSTFAMMFAYAETTATGSTVTAPKAYADAADGEKLWDVDFSSSYFTPIDDTTEVFMNNGITYSEDGLPGGNASAKSIWRKNINAGAKVVEENGAALKIDGAVAAVGTEGQEGYQPAAPAETPGDDHRFVGQINPYDLENKTYTYEFEYFRKGIARSKVYFANGAFTSSVWWLAPDLYCLGIELDADGYRLMRQSSASDAGVLGSPTYVTDKTTKEISTRMKIVLEGSAIVEDKVLVEGNDQSLGTTGRKHWIGDAILVTYTIYNSIVREDGHVHDVLVATDTLYQPADVKLVFGIGEWNSVANGQYYGARNLAIYKGDTSVEYDFGFKTFYNHASWGDNIAIFEAKGIVDSNRNNANGYSWTVRDDITVDGEGIMYINGKSDKLQGAYTPNPLGKEWNYGYYEMEMTLNNTGRLKIGLLDFEGLSRVGFDILPNGFPETFELSSSDLSAYLWAKDAATLWTSGGDTFGTGIVEESTPALAPYVKTIVYDTFVADDDTDTDKVPQDSRNVRDYGGNRANIKITFDCVNYVITLYEKCNSKWRATVAIDYSKAVEQNILIGSTLDFFAYDADTNATIKNVKITKGMTATHLYTYAIADMETEIFNAYDETIPAALAEQFAERYGLTEVDFGWTVDGETLCKDMKAVYDDLESTNYGPQTIKLAPIVNYSTLATTPIIRGVQTKYNDDKTAYEVRFVSAIGDLETFAKIGYDVKKTVKVGTDVTTTTEVLETTEVSVLIYANGMRYYATALGGEYAVALGFKGEDVIENSEVTYEVTAYYIARNGEKIVCGDAVSFMFVNGEYTVQG